ncbi:NAD(P)-binding domain-containing protein [Novosphingobium sp. FSY-8]|uniref:NAD(P)-binding domain-containing protein n=1 Tax=Novosphingobium ovatum TaxID=1908523 RepID=A0ABW9XC82_9SPHN|nr:NAD(P)/FAD-dependent oxidoreductase [Novosphingobium ovatum]NBC36156.1 NAD(P)-binding domain-containing protein [Novosphingobium ovatum]
MVQGNTGDTPAHVDVLIVGAGFSGLYQLHLLRQRGWKVAVIDAAGGVGGTWYWNRYPGARCDIPSIEYSYSFDADLQAEWRWTERYATQPEILSYLNHVADRFDLRRDIRLNTRMDSATWDEAAGLWRVALNPGGAMSARYVILATGALSAPKLPDWPGIEGFSGEIVHTGAWRDDIDLRGKRVGIVGTGSSGVQAIPRIAEVAAHLTVYLRTPSFAVPASNRPLDAGEQEALAPQMAALREGARQSPLGWFDGPRPGMALSASETERAQRYEEQWNAGTTGLLLAYEDLLIDEDANTTAAQFARGKIAQLVHDPDTARRLTPTGYPIGSRRLCSEIGYYEAFNRDNVSLVDLRETPIERVEGNRLITSAGAQELDVLVLATGFNAMTGAIAAIDITGRDGAKLAREWEDGPRCYLGLAVAGFPNMFTVTGPGSPSVLSNVVVSIEQHVEWIADCLDHLRATGTATIAADPATEAAWMQHCDEVAHMTLFPRSISWYQGRTRDGRLVFMPYVGGVGAYRAKCDAVAAAGYDGFVLTTNTPEQEEA